MCWLSDMVLTSTRPAETVANIPPRPTHQPRRRVLRSAESSSIHAIFFEVLAWSIRLNLGVCTKYQIYNSFKLARVLGRSSISAFVSSDSKKPGVLGHARHPERGGVCCPLSSVRAALETDRGVTDSGPALERHTHKALSAHTTYHPPSLVCGPARPARSGRSRQRRRTWRKRSRMS